MNVFRSISEYYRSKRLCRIEQNALQGSINLMWRGIENLLEASIEQKREIIHSHQITVSCLDALNKSIAGLSKRISSIEMEMVMARGGCLDNNFEGKQDL